MKALVSIIGIVLVAGAAHAGPRDFIVEHAGEGGDKEAAAPYIDAFLRHVEKQAGWPAKSATGEFIAEPEEAVKFIEGKKPGFGLLDPDLWLELRKKYNLEVIGTVEGTHQAGGHFVIVSKDAKKLEDLNGKKVESNHPFSEKYLEKIVLGQKPKFTLVKQSSMIKSVKHAARGEADGALITDDEWKSQQSTYPDLHVVWTSEGKLPPTPVVVFKKVASEKDREAFVKAILDMCKAPPGADICKQLDIKNFASPDKAAYDDAVKRYEK
jgi:hypothetical protein